MAASSSYRMAFQRQQSNQCIDPSDMDGWLDFNAIASPATTSMSRKSSHVPSIASPASTIVGPVDVNDEHQTPVQPSHDYRRFRQTTGLPANSVAGLKSISENGQEFVFADTFDAGVDDFSMSIYEGAGMGSNSGLGSMTGDFNFGDMSPEMTSFLYQSAGNSQQDGFSVDPAALSQEVDSKANVRFYPGMHQEQAAIAKAQAEANQLRHQQMMRQRQQLQSQNTKEDPHYEETIQRALAQIRQNSALHADDDFSGPSNGSRSKKDEEDMDEDERLLNSEEGKKLSSKERRQLRNKVSARAFRSRRKEYITQLEAEINQKVAENTDLKHANRALMGENEAFRTLAQVFVSHPAFRTVVADISRNPDLSAALAKMTGPSPQAQQSQPQQQMQRKDVDPYTAAQMGQIPIPQQESQHIGMAMVPEQSIDFSQLSLGVNNWAVPGMPMPSFQTPQVFAVVDVSTPEAPAFEEMSIKGESILDRLEESFGQHAVKSQEPELSTAALEKELSGPTAAPVEDAQYNFDESDEDVTLFASCKAVAPVPTERPSTEDLTSKPVFVVRVISETEDANVSARLDRLLARMDKKFERLNAMTSAFDF